MNYAGLNKQEKHAAVANASNVDELNEMWEQFHAEGYSLDGLLHAAVLKRKAELGAPLSDMEQATVNLADLRATAGAALPPIEGKLHGGS